MVLVEGGYRDGAGRPLHLPGGAVRRHLAHLRDGGIGALPFENIAEPAHQRSAGRRVHPAGDPAALGQGEGPDVVDAVALVGVVMGEQQAVEAPDARGGGLQAKFRRGVHHHAGLAIRLRLG